ncbi:unnamed protein product, partial [marine sediment metagenome]
MDSTTAGTPIWTMIARNDGYFLLGRSGVSNDFYFDPSGNATFAGNVTINGSIAGNSNNTTEVGTYSTGAIKRIRMVQGGELHFGDTTTGAPLGITEGNWNNFGDNDYLSIYGRSQIKFYSGGINPALRLTLGTNST